LACTVGGEVHGRPFAQVLSANAPTGIELQVVNCVGEPDGYALALRGIQRETCDA
jgi:hypothetical protein